MASRIKEAIFTQLLTDKYGLHSLKMDRLVAHSLTAFLTRPTVNESLSSALPRKLLRNGALTLRETPAGVVRKAAASQQHRSIAARVIKQVWPLLPQRKEGCVACAKSALDPRPATTQPPPCCLRILARKLISVGAKMQFPREREGTANCGCLAS